MGKSLEKCHSPDCLADDRRPSAVDLGHDSVSDISDAYATSPSSQSVPIALESYALEASGRVDAIASESTQVRHPRETAFEQPSPSHISIAPFPSNPFNPLPSSSGTAPEHSPSSADLITEIEAALKDSHHGMDNRMVSRETSDAVVPLTEMAADPVSETAADLDRAWHTEEFPSPTEVPRRVVKDSAIEDGAASADDATTETQALSQESSKVGGVSESRTARQPSEQSNFKSTGPPASQQHLPPSASMRGHQPRHESVRVERVAKHRQDDDIDGLLSRNLPLPPAMSYDEVSNMPFARQRAIAYATKINALSKEESGLQYWVRRRRDKGKKGEIRAILFSLTIRECVLTSCDGWISWAGHGQELKPEL
jgi:hypothetical protein